VLSPVSSPGLPSWSRTFDSTLVRLSPSPVVPSDDVLTRDYLLGLKYHNISRDTLPYKAPMQPYLSWAGLSFIFLIVFFNGPSLSPSLAV
jgi:hypothetical protein